MKTYKLIIACLAGLLITSCDSELKENADLNVSVIPGEGVSFDGEVVTVKKGSNVEFKLDGEPDLITFYSGEKEHTYEYRKRITIDENDIEESTLKFSIFFQYGTPATGIEFNTYISEDFEGLLKNNFKQDSVNVEKHQWADLVPPSEIPMVTGTAAKATECSVDLKPYLGKKITIAFRYKGLNPAKITQSKVNIVKMAIENKMKDGNTTNLIASDFGFTPLNMMNWTYKPANVANNDYAYGITDEKPNKDVEGYWRFKENDIKVGTFYLQSTGAGATKPAQYSWLVSKMMVINACSPDAGIPIKDITQSLPSYSYTYDEPGTYTATFEATNANFKKESSVIRQLTVKVVE